VTCPQLRSSLSGPWRVLGGARRTPARAIFYRAGGPEPCPASLVACGRRQRCCGAGRERSREYGAGHSRAGPFASACGPCGGAICISLTVCQLERGCAWVASVARFCLDVHTRVLEKSVVVNGTPFESLTLYHSNSPPGRRSDPASRFSSSRWPGGAGATRWPASTQGTLTGCA
jgi:hypothetical protein